MLPCAAGLNIVMCVDMSLGGSGGPEAADRWTALATREEADRVAVDRWTPLVLAVSSAIRM